MEILNKMKNVFGVM